MRRAFVRPTYYYFSSFFFPVKATWGFCVLLCRERGRGVGGEVWGFLVVCVCVCFACLVLVFVGSFHRRLHLGCFPSFSIISSSSSCCLQRGEGGKEGEKGAGIFLAGEGGGGGWGSGSQFTIRIPISYFFSLEKSMVFSSPLRLLFAEYLACPNVQFVLC